MIHDHQASHRSALCRMMVLAAVGSLFVASTAVASPVPVFQHVLEHWEADPYDVVVHHEGELSESQQAVLERLRAAERGEPRPANITVITRDHAEIDNPSASAEDLPRIEVRYPVMSGIRRTVWSGELSAASVDMLLDSPVRQEIAGHLLDRKAAVWVLLESGDEQKDEAALQTLERQLPRLASSLQVPEVSDFWKQMDLGEIQRDVDFAIVRVSRDDAEERLLVNMLLELERDLRDFDGEPIVFPVYGRGLAMHALIGAGINDRMLAATGEFLVGPCSTCQVKSDDTGVDLLMSVDWEENVETRSSGEVAGAGPGGF